MLKIRKGTVCGITYYQANGGEADYIKDEKLGWVSINGTFLKWIKSGRTDKYLLNQGLRWICDDKEIAELEAFIKENTNGDN